jgi:nucleoside 2-deoxyribosyltransferase
MKKIYLCGPITGRPDYEQHFLNVEETILNKTHGMGLQIKTVNPSQFTLKKEPWEICLRYCIKAMLSCDGIALLQGWENSQGCKLELSIAGQLKIPVVHLEPPVDSSIVRSFLEMPIYSDVPRYFQNRFAQLEAEGRDEMTWEDIALVETCNRFLDPYGFEYIERNRV